MPDNEWRLYLRFSETKAGSHFESLWPGQVFVFFKLFLQLQQLLTGKSCSRAPSLSQQGVLRATCKIKQDWLQTQLCVLRATCKLNKTGYRPKNVCWGLPANSTRLVTDLIQGLCKVVSILNAWCWGQFYELFKQHTRIDPPTTKPTNPMQTTQTAKPQITIPFYF